MTLLVAAISFLFGGLIGTLITAVLIGGAICGDDESERKSDDRVHK